VSALTSRERVLAALHHQEADRVPIDLGAMRSSGIHAIAYNRLKVHLGTEGGPWPVWRGPWPVWRGPWPVWRGQDGQDRQDRQDGQDGQDGQDRQDRQDGQDGQTRLYDIMQQLAQPEMAIVDRFQLDALPLPRAVIGLDPARPRWKPWRLPDGSPAFVPDGLQQVRREDGALEICDEEGRIIYRMPAGGLYYEPVYEPLAHANTIAEIEAWQPPRISDAELAWLAVEARRLRATTDKAIVGLTGQRIYEGAQFARGWQRFMEDLAGQPALAQALLQRLADSACADLARYLDAVGEFIDIVQVGDDLGTQNGPQLSPRMYRRIVKPYQQQMWQFIKARSGLPVFLHCCGGIYPLIPDLIEAGVDILNPVQISAAGMDPVRLKAEFGRDLVFWGGGADTQHVLAEATPEQVADHVRRQIDILAPGGGFVFNQVHNIQANVPPENIVAMLDAALAYGVYDSIRARANRSDNL
jgi:uroporphyrinogen decarboxylase